MKTDKLTFRFHNPNTEEATADHIISILIQANQPKVEQALKDAAGCAAIPVSPVAIT